jgi:preprotein translocase subunit SecG
MNTLIMVLILLVAILTIGIVLIQESKGGGLASSFSNSNQLMGVRKTTDFLEKATWTLAIVLVVLSVAYGAFIPSSDAAQPAVVDIATPTGAGNTQTFPTAPAGDAQGEQAPAQQQPAQPAE